MQPIDHDDLLATKQRRRRRQQQRQQRQQPQKDVPSSSECCIMPLSRANSWVLASTEHCSWSSLLYDHTVSTEHHQSACTVYMPSTRFESITCDRKPHAIESIAHDLVISELNNRSNSGYSSQFAGCVRKCCEQCCDLFGAR